MKVCIKCNNTKPMMYFYSGNICKSCKITYQQKYYEANKERIRSYNTKWQRQRYQSDLEYKLKDNLRARLRLALKNNSRTGSAVKDLGCSINEFKEYLESKFQPGMTWDNHQLDGWHIDHIIPLLAFDLSDPKQFKKACHYTNLQPLWAKDNLSKGGI